MQNVTRLFLGPFLVLVLCSVVTQGAQTKTKSSEDSKAATAKKPNYERLPRHFGKLELKDEQVEEIYAIRSDFGPRIDALEKELEELKDAEEAAIKDVLTRTQVTALNKILDDSGSSSKSSATARSSSKSGSRSSSSRRKRKKGDS